MAALTTPAALDELRAAVRGDVLARNDPGYEEARQLYNASIDRRPAVIVRCRDVADVQAALAAARRDGLEVAIRGGGHNAAGLGSVDDGLVIDLSPMNWVRVEPESKRVGVGAGCTLGDVDHATHSFGLAVPMGVLSTTGIAGLTLGGGVGHLTRQHGLAIDNLLGADVVLADGSFVRASATENADLFWALRGGGGNFGVVTAFTFQAHDHTTVVGGPTLWHIDEAEGAMAFYRDFMAQAPDEVNGFFAFLTVPPGPPFPEELHGKTMCGVVWCFTGDSADAEEALRPAREYGPPALDGVGEVPLPALQAAFDALYPPGLQSYWRGDFIADLGPDAIRTYVEHGSNLPSPLSTVHLYPIDGAAGRIAPDATPWSYRDARWAQVIFAVDPEPGSIDRLRDWAKAYSDAVLPYSKSDGGAYINFISDSTEERLRASYRDNYDRLRQVKTAYDPENVFHVNWNIPPAD